MTCRFRWPTWTHRWKGGSKFAFDVPIDLWRSLWLLGLFPWQHHTAGKSVSAPIRLVTAVEDRVRASQIIKSLMLAQCYWLILHCVSWAADSKVFIFYRSHAVIHRRFTMCELAVGTLHLESFSFKQVQGQRFYKLNANKRLFFCGWAVTSESQWCKITEYRHTNLDYTQFRGFSFDFSKSY